MTQASTNFVATATWGSFGLVIGINVLIAIIVLIIFWILRAHVKKTKYFFAPQYYNQQGTADELPDPGTGFFSWLKPLFNFTDADMLRMRGLDSVLYVRIIQMMLWIFLLFIIFGIGILVPINYTAPQEDFTGSEENNIRGVPQISIAHVSNQSNRLYANAIIAWVYTFIVFFFTYRFWKQYVALRTAWMQTNSAHNYTVMYKAEHPLTQSPIEVLRQQFPGEVSDIQFGVHANELRKLTNSWKDTNKKLYFARLAYQNTNKRPMHRLKPIIGDKVDSINFYTALLEEQRKIIEREREILQQTNPLTHTGFVTFKSIDAAYLHAQEKRVAQQGFHFTPSPAPEETDVTWDLLSKSPNRRKIFTLLLFVIVFVLIFFWGAISVFAQGIVNLKSLAQLSAFHWLNAVLNWNVALTGLITGFLPPLVLQILFGLVPTILAALVKLRGAYSKSQIQRSVTKMYFIFLVVNVFLVSLLAGGAFWVLYELIHSSATSSLILLGQGVPAQATFFINYVIVYALVTNMVKLLNPGALIISLLKSSRAKSPEAKHDAQKSKPIKYDVLYAVHLLIFTLGYTYSTIAPFILPWIALYFCTAWLVGKYLLIYSQKPEYDSGGLFWKPVFHRIIAALVLSDLVMIGFFILKKSKAWAVIIPLPLLSIAFALLMHYMFNKNTVFLPAGGRADGLGDTHTGKYIDPVFSTNFQQEMANPVGLPAKVKEEQDQHKRNQEVGGSAV